MSGMAKHGNASKRDEKPLTIRCRGCGGDLVKNSPESVRIAIGKIKSVAHGIETFSEKGDAWGHMHLRCFYMAVGDPQGIDMMTTAAAS